MILVVFIDGLKYNLIKDHMPFLNSLNKKRLLSDFGYSCTCHATIYTGMLPEKHGLWFVWNRDGSTPFGITKYLPQNGFFDNLPIRFAVNRIVRKVVKNDSFPGIPLLVNLPLKYWHEFNVVEKKMWNSDGYLSPYKTIFEILRDNKISHSFNGVNKKLEYFQQMVEARISNDLFQYFFVGDIDNYMHSYGDDSSIVFELLGKLDTEIRNKFETILKSDPDAQIVCFSDHGHINVDEEIDINSFFKSEGDEITNYIHLVESTFVRFWTRNGKESGRILNILKNIESAGYGFLVDETVAGRYGLNFPHNKYGDLVFHIKAPRILVNTIWGYGKSIRSMHGYEPELENHHGFFASNLKMTEKEYVQLVDILPSILDLLEIDGNKYGLEGEILWK